MDYRAKLMMVLLSMIIMRVVEADINVSVPDDDDDDHHHPPNPSFLG